MGSAHTRKFFEKNLTKNFHAWDSANIGCSTVERRCYDKKICPHVSKFLKDGGSGEEKLFPKKFSSPALKSINHNPLFLWHKRRKEKALQKETPFFYGLCPNPQVF